MRFATVRAFIETTAVIRQMVVVEVPIEDDSFEPTEEVILMASQDYLHDNRWVLVDEINPEQRSVSEYDILD